MQYGRVKKSGVVSGSAYMHVFSATQPVYIFWLVYIMHFIYDNYWYCMTHLSAGFQRIAKRDKKAFLSSQCKEIEENNRMGKTRVLFKKIRNTKGTFQVKMSTIKDKKCIDLTKAEDIKKRWQEYTE